MKDTYLCKKCGDEWGFFPEDYDDPWDYPTICPHCSMPVTQLFRDIYEEEGLREALYQVLRRVF